LTYALSKQEHAYVIYRKCYEYYTSDTATNSYQPAMMVLAYRFCKPSTTV